MREHDTVASEADLVDQDTLVDTDEDTAALPTDALENLAGPDVLSDADPADVVEQHRTVVLDEER